MQTLIRRTLGSLAAAATAPANGIGDVVEFQIEEYLETEAREPFNRPRAFRREELEPNLEEACRTAKPPRQGAGRP